MGEPGEVTVILANGAFPSAAGARAALEAARRVVCCDGAADRLWAAGLAPDWVVGDLDSLSAESRARFAERLSACPEQETNDLAKAFRFCLSRGWRDLLILGATGLREDHTLANLSLLADFAREARVRLLTDTGLFTPFVTGECGLATQAGQPLSFFAAGSAVRLWARGVRYPVEGLLLDRWWKASLNEATGEWVELRIDGEGVLVFQAQ